MMKIIQILMVVILSLILILIIILAFNPFNSRTKLIGSMINSYLSNTIEDYTPINSSTNTTSDSTDKHPLLNESQEEKLESFGVNIEQLPPSVTPSMQECFEEKLGKERAEEIAKGDTPSTFEFLKAKECIGK